jgi:hypothetical protein
VTRQHEAGPACISHDLVVHHAISFFGGSCLQMCLTVYNARVIHLYKDGVVKKVSSLSSIQS